MKKATTRKLTDKLPKLVLCFRCTGCGELKFVQAASLREAGYLRKQSSESHVGHGKGGGYWACGRIKFGGVYRREQ